MTSPAARPAITGSIPDSNIATHSATPIRTAAWRRQTGAKRGASSAANRPIAASNAGIEMCFV